MHLAYAWRLAVRKYFVILLLALAGLLAGFGYTSLFGSYSTTTYLTVLPKKEATGSRAVDPQRFFQTETQAILSDEVLGASVDALQDGTTVEQLRRDIELSDGSSGDVLGLTVSGPTAQSALARKGALLSAVNGHNFGNVTMTGLWTSSIVAPRRAQLWAAGLSAGAAAGLVLVLLWGAARRPVYHPRYLQLSRKVRTYPVVVTFEDPKDVQQFKKWLGQPAVRVVAVGEAEAEARRLAAQVGVQESESGSTVLVVAVGRATEHAVEEQASLTPGTSPPVLVLVSSNEVDWGDTHRGAADAPDHAVTSRWGDGARPIPPKSATDN